MSEDPMMQQRANSSVNIENQQSDSSSTAEDSSPDDIEVDEVDVTPRCIQSQPACIRRTCFSTIEMIVGWVFLLAFLPLSGPIVLCTTLFLTSPTRRLLQEFKEKGGVIVGRVAKKSITRLHFLKSKGEARVLVIEYDVPCSDFDSESGNISSYRKKIQVLKSEFDDYVQGSAVELLLLPGKPKSAMIKKATEKYVASASSRDTLWFLLFGVFLTIYMPAWLYSIVSSALFLSWDAFWHGCIIGAALFALLSLVLVSDSPGIPREFPGNSPFPWCGGENRVPAGTSGTVFWSRRFPGIPLTGTGTTCKLGYYVVARVLGIS